MPPRSRSAPALVRNADGGNSVPSVLHPLTRQHNQHLAKSTGAIFEKHDEIVLEYGGCRCAVCRSPRGVWRNDDLDTEILCELQRMKTVEDNKEDEPKSPPPTLTKRRPQLKKLESSFFCLGDDMSEIDNSEWPTPPRARPKTAPLLRSATRTAFPGEVTISDDETINELYQCVKTVNYNRGVRPGSAPAGGRQKQKSQRELRAEAVRERKRRQHDGFVARCRAEWDAKVLSMDWRKQRCAANALASAEADKIASRMRIERENQIARWIILIKTILVLNSFQEFVTSGRIIQLVSMGGESLVKMLEKGIVTRRRRHRWTVCGRPFRIAIREKLQHAHAIAGMFPILRRISLQGPVDINSVELAQRLEHAVQRKTKILSVWGVSCYCLILIGKLKRQVKLRRAGKIIANALFQMSVANSMYAAFRSFSLQIRQMQVAVRNWIKRERTRHALIAQLLERTEQDTLRRRWAEEDLRTIRAEKKRLRHLRVVKERKACERFISVVTETYRRYKRPRSDADFAYLRHQFSKHGAPALVWNLCTHHIYFIRKLLIKRRRDERARRHEKYDRAMQCWRDIEQAVQILDPTSHNPDPLPKAPPRERIFHFTVEDAIAGKIVSEVTAWCGQNQRLLRESCQQAACDACVRLLDFPESREFMKQLPAQFSQINITMEDIVKSVLVPKDADGKRTSTIA